MAIYKAMSVPMACSLRYPAEELTQLFSCKPGSHLDRVATFTMQQRVLSSGSADRESQTPALG